MRWEKLFKSALWKTPAGAAQQLLADGNLFTAPQNESGFYRNIGVRAGGSNQWKLKKIS